LIIPSSYVLCPHFTSPTVLLLALTATPQIYTLSLHDALPIFRATLADLSVVADAVVGAALSTAGKRGGSAADRLDTQIDRIRTRSEEHTSELQSRENLVCRLLLEKKKKQK